MIFIKYVVSKKPGTLYSLRMRDDGVQFLWNNPPVILAYCDFCSRFPDRATTFVRTFRRLVSRLQEAG